MTEQLWDPVYCSYPAIVTRGENATALPKTLSVTQSLGMSKLKSQQ